MYFGRKHTGLANVTEEAKKLNEDKINFPLRSVSGSFECEKLVMPHRMCVRTTNTMKIYSPTDYWLLAFWIPFLTWHLTAWMLRSIWNWFDYSAAQYMDRHNLNLQNFRLCKWCMGYFWVLLQAVYWFFVRNILRTNMKMWVNILSATISSAFSAVVWISFVLWCRWAFSHNPFTRFY